MSSSAPAPVQGLLQDHELSQYPKDIDWTKEPKKLAAACKPICVEMLRELGYIGGPVPKPKSVEELLQYMLRRAVELGVSPDNPRSAKAFRLGYSEGLLAHPNHPIEAQGYVALLTWLVATYDDTVGQQNEMIEEAMQFQQRFITGQRQPNIFLQAIVTLLHEAYDHFDPILANLLQVSVLKFLSSNLLEQHQGFKTMPITPAGVQFPYFFRDLSGLNIVYTVFCFPKQRCPDLSQFLEAIPDMSKFIDISNDVLSFYKEELGGDHRNYISNLAFTTGKPIIECLLDVQRDAIGCAKRAENILRGRGVYYDTWQESVQGYMAMHTVNPRYKLEDLGIAEVHPLMPFEEQIEEFFKQYEQSRKA